jgi:hypothetical protein
VRRCGEEERNTLDDRKKKLRFAGNLSSGWSKS